MPNKQRAVLFANGEIPDLAAAKEMLLEDDLVIAVDGGLHHLIRIGRKPSWLVGDLDSVSADEVKAYEAEGVEVFRFSIEKDETDLELALQYAMKAGVSQIIIAGALGGRLDQTLGNVFLLFQMVEKQVDLRLDDGSEEVFLIRDRVRITGRQGDIVSLLPIMGNADGVTTIGLRYPLSEETLYPDRTRGISNEMLSEKAEISVKRGVLLCIHTRKIADTPF